MLQEAGLEFDVCHTSLLSRANETLDIILREIGQPNLPVYKSWRLNERHYGALTGFNKLQTAQKYGAEQVKSAVIYFTVSASLCSPTLYFYIKILLLQ